MVFNFTANFRSYITLTLLVTISMLFLGCGFEGQKLEQQVFRYNEFRNITSLDPAFARNPQNIWPIQQLFNGLVQLDDSLNIQPEIARRWEISSEGTIYTFFLREDVYFHDSPVFGSAKSRTVTAEDFVFSFDRLQDLYHFPLEALVCIHLILYAIYLKAP